MELNHQRPKGEIGNKSAAYLHVTLHYRQIARSAIVFPQDTFFLSNHQAPFDQREHRTTVRRLSSVRYPYEKRSQIKPRNSPPGSRGAAESEPTAPKADSIPQILTTWQHATSAEMQPWANQKSHVHVRMLITGYSALLYCTVL